LLLVILQCDKVAIVKDGAVVYFGPYDAAALNTHMPVDHMLADATVEAKDSAAAPADAEKVRRRTRDMKA
jgi:ABC-type multidrug transport system ATPase subunit